MRLFFFLSSNNSNRSGMPEQREGQPHCVGGFYAAVPTYRRRGEQVESIKEDMEARASMMVALQR